MAVIRCLSIHVKSFQELSRALMNRLNCNRSSSSAIAASRKGHDESLQSRNPRAAEPDDRQRSACRAVLDPVGGRTSPPVEIRFSTCCGRRDRHEFLLLDAAL